MTTFKPGALFSGSAVIMPPDSDIAAVSLTFKVESEATPPPPGTTMITPLMVAEALSDLAEANGWPAITFSGPPVDEPLN